MEPLLIVNKWKCKDGTILNSRSRHDFVDHYDAKGEYYMVDGGLSYIRHTVNMECMCVYSDDPHEKIRDNFEWGSYGKNGDEEMHYILLKNLTHEHIDAILKTQKQLPEHIKNMFQDELKFRSEL